MAEEFKKTRGYKKWCKDNGYTESYMQSEWDRAVLEGGSQLVDWLAKRGGNWYNMGLHQIAQIPGLADRLKKSKEEKEKAEEEKMAALEKEEKDKEYYQEHMDEILVNKIDSGESLTEKEIRDFLWECGEDVCDINGSCGRWMMSMRTIKRVCGRYWEIDWQKGLTEYQENEIDEQPFEVKKHEYEKKIVVTEWLKI